MQTLKNWQLPGDITVEMIGDRIVFRQLDISLDTGEKIGTWFEINISRLNDIRCELNITDEMRIIRKNQNKFNLLKNPLWNLNTTPMMISSNDIRPNNEKRYAWNSWKNTELNKKRK